MHDMIDGKFRVERVLSSTQTDQKFKVNDTSGNVNNTKRIDMCKINNICIIVISCAYICLSCNNAHDSNLEEKNENPIEYDSEYSDEYKINIVNNDTIVYSNKFDDSLSVSDKIIASSFENFAFDGLKKYTNKINENFVYSPLNASLVFSLMNNAANEKEQKEINKYIGISDIYSDFSNTYNRKVVGNIKKKLDDNGNEINISNKIWVKKESYIYRSFISVLNSYNAKIEGIDFGKDSDKNWIDSYIQDNSNFNDVSLSSEYEENMNALFSTSVRFSMQWKGRLNTFKNEKFFNENGKIVSCEKIGVNSVFNYIDCEYYNITEIPFVDSDYSMFLIYTPYFDDRYINVLNDIISQGGIDGYIQRMEITKLELKFPKFSVENIIPLIDTDKLSLKYYSKVSPNSFMLNSISQICAMEVDENGISARAIVFNPSIWDKLLMTSSPNMQDQYTENDINGPFWFLIRNNKLKTILFAGCVKNIAS